MSQTTSDRKIDVKSIEKNDLNQFMYGEPPANVAEIVSLLNKHKFQKSKLVVRVSVDSKHLSHDERVMKVAKKHLLSKRVSKELSKSKPNYAKKWRELVIYSMAFLSLAVFTAITLPQPLNWFVAVSCIVPPLLTAAKTIKEYNTENGRTDNR